MAISFGRNEGFLLREEFVCKAIGADELSMAANRLQRIVSDRAGKLQRWRIDEALQLQRVDVIPDTLAPVAVKEQFLDTILLRNAGEVISDLMGQPVHFLFHSHDYWGEFDLCFVAQDGTVIVIENKSGRVSGASRKKFRNDVEAISADLPAKIEQRFNHVLQFRERYEKLAKRAFAACFLNVRCDVVKDSRDLWAEAAAKLGVSPEELESRFHRANQWLDNSSKAGTLAAYLAARDAADLRSELIPILIGRHITQVDLVKWNAESTTRPKQMALAVEMQVFGTDDHPAQFCSLQLIGEFAV